MIVVDVPQTELLSAVDHIDRTVRQIRMIEHALDVACLGTAQPLDRILDTPFQTLDHWTIHAYARHPSTRRKRRNAERVRGYTGERARTDQRAKIEDAAFKLSICSIQPCKIGLGNLSRRLRRYII